MRKLSRQMPKLKQSSITPLNWLVLITVGIGLLYGIFYLVWKFPLLLILVASIILASIVLYWRSQQRLRSLAEHRASESICSFTRSFDYRNVDTWVIRAVYEQVQEYIGFRCPVRASDRLVEDLQIDPEDLVALIAEVAERTGRTLAGTEIICTTARSRRCRI
jgi:hypothetical protein